MKKSTLLKTLLVGIASLALVCLPIPAMAQHGGHGGGGGGGGHVGGGGGGGFHGGGSSGGYHGGGSYGGSHGGYSGGYGGSHGGYAGRGSYGGGSRGSYGSGARGAYGGGMHSGSYHAWASESHSGVRNTSPGWHSFERGGNTAGAAVHSGATGAEHSNLARPVNGFAGTHTSASFATHNFVGGSFAHAGFVGPWRPGWGGGWRGGWGWGGWRGGWGWGGWGWGWWGPGWGWGWWGPGWGWGLGWGGGWGPFWAWPPYNYYPWWSYDYDSTPDYLN